MSFLDAPTVSLFVNTQRLTEDDTSLRPKLSERRIAQIQSLANLESPLVDARNIIHRMATDNLYLHYRLPVPSYLTDNRALAALEGVDADVCKLIPRLFADLVLTPLEVTNIPRKPSTVLTPHLLQRTLLELGHMGVLFEHCITYLRLMQPVWAVFDTLHAYIYRSISEQRARAPDEPVSPYGGVVIQEFSIILECSLLFIRYGKE